MDETAAVFLGGDAAPVGASDLDFVRALGGDLARMQRIARLLTGNADEAEELVAEAIARSLPRWRSGDVGDASAYVRQVVVNLASRRWRRVALARRRDHRALDWLAPPREAESNLVERDCTLREVMSLPARRRAVVVLRFYDDLSEAQIADVLGVTVGTVKSQLSRALKQLRERLGALEEL